MHLAANEMQLYLVFVNNSYLQYCVDAAYCYRPNSAVCHTSEPCKNGSTDQDAV